MSYRSSLVLVTAACLLAAVGCGKKSEPTTQVSAATTPLEPPKVEDPWPPREVWVFAADETLWRALPKDIAAWWRRRNASTIERVNGAWAVDGPALGEGRIELVDSGPV